ncbi:MAG: hypothetical protein HY859_09610, partial [Caulobacterales bacterium]|nr:hypothetical protein [Caulobacterales bacterium]
FRSVEFVFKADRLTFVVLNGDVALFELVDTAVAQQYGQAVAVHDDGREKVYADRIGGNTISVRQWASGNGMSVVYEPLASGF